MATIGTTTEIRTFTVDTRKEDLVELHRRIAGTRWPSRELVDDRSQGALLRDRAFR